MDTNQDVLARIGPRYQLQYKIDLALQKLYSDMDEQQTEDTDQEVGSSYDVDVANGTGDDLEGTTARWLLNDDDKTLQERPLSSSASTSSASGSENVAQTSDRSGDESPPRVHAWMAQHENEPDQNELAISKSADIEENSEAVDENGRFADGFQQTVSVDDVTSSPPVPRPRVRKVSVTSDSPEEAVSDPDESTAAAAADLLETESFSKVTMLSDDGSIELSPRSGEAASYTNVRQTSATAGKDADKSEAENEPVSSETQISSADEGEALESSSAERVSQVEEEDERNSDEECLQSDDSAHSSMDTSSIDELNDDCDHYTYEITPEKDDVNFQENQEIASFHSVDFDTATNDNLVEVSESKDNLNEMTKGNLDEMDTVSTDPLYESTGETHVSSTTYSSASASENEDDEVKKGHRTSPAELLAPHLARTAVLEGIQEVVRRSVETTGSNDATRSAFEVIEQGGADHAVKQITEECEMDVITTADNSNLLQHTHDEQPSESVTDALNDQEVAECDFTSDIPESVSVDVGSSISIASSRRSDSSCSDHESSLSNSSPGPAVTEALASDVSQHSLEVSQMKDSDLATKKFSKSPDITADTTEIFSKSKPEPEAGGEPENTEMQIIEEVDGTVHDDQQEASGAKPTYSAAHSQRNTDASKWFGVPQPKEKVWLKSKGKVDADAEAERRKVVKSMTKKHNPNFIPKWQPPVEKDWKDNLNSHQKESLRKYEERRRSKIENDDTTRSRALSVESFADSVISEPDGVVVPEQQNRQVYANSEIVVESVVHSRDAISIWENRLNSKFEKEETEKKRLSLGKQRRAEREAKRRARTESTSSVTSVSSIMSDLPASENIVRESIGVANVRNRWRDIEQSAETTPKKPSPSRRSNSFTVNAGSPYRTYANPPPVSPKPQTAERPINAAVTTATVIPGESAIDREIREAAEREEKWRSEKETPKLTDSHPELLSSLGSNIEPQNLHVPVPADPNINRRVSSDIDESIEREAKWAEEHHNMSKSPNSEKVVQEEIITPVKIQRAQTAPNLEFAFPDRQMNEEVNITSTDSKEQTAVTTDLTETVDGGTDSGIECNVSSAVTRSDVTSPTSGGHEDEYSSSELSTTSQDEREAQTPKDHSPGYSRAHVQSLPSVMSPKGWVAKPAITSPVSPRPSLEQKSFYSPKHTWVPPSKSPTTPDQPLPQVDAPPVNGTQHETDEVSKSGHDESSHSLQLDEDEVNQLPGASKTTMVVTKQRSGPIFEVVSSKNRLQTIMELELKEAEKREEEWRRKQLLDSAESKPAENIVQTPKPAENIAQTPKPAENIAQTPRPAETTAQTPKPAENTFITLKVQTSKAPEPQKVTSPPPIISPKQTSPSPVTSTKNGDITDQIPKEQKQEDVASEAVRKINTSSSVEYRKLSVVKANRVPRRKSALAMRWEAGNYRNNEDA